MISYIQGDLFTHKPADPAAATILAHACNCRGSWGAGVAATFRKKFPSSYQKYASFCHDHSDDPAALLGTTLLIPDNNTYIACLFTSDLTGRNKLLPDDIVQHTQTAMNHLHQQLNQLDINFERNTHIVVNMPKINAGLFGVPWEDTESVLEDHKDLDINVYVID